MKLQHFYFTGDGRGTSGHSDASTEQRQALAMDILGNFVGMLMNAGWEAVNTAYDSTSCESFTVTVPGTAIDKTFYMKINTTDKVLEAPLRFPIGDSYTRMYLMYNYGSGGKSVSKHLGDEGGDNTLWFDYTNATVNNRPSQCGLHVLYIPAGCSDANKFRLASFAVNDADGHGSHPYSLPIENNENDVYTHSIITENDIVYFHQHSSAWEDTKAARAGIKGFVVGPLLETLYNASDSSCSYRKYCMINYRMTVATYDREEWQAESLEQITGSTSVINTTSVPAMQWYDASGNLQICNNQEATANSAGFSLGLFYGSEAISVMSKIPQSNFQISEITIGNYAKNYESYPNGECKVTANSSLKGRLNSKYFIQVDDMNTATHRFTTGQTFNNKSYVYLGCGVAIGWPTDADIGLVDDSINKMSTVSAVNKSFVFDTTPEEVEESK